MGQWLSMPMIVAGIALLAWSYRRAGGETVVARQS
jgi:phosphatidylglycerol:prolipoprotein diacylglycerol transferase